MPKFINKIIKIMITSDFFLNLGWGFLSPVFAIFIVKNIAYGNTFEAARIAGFASLIYWLVKSILQIPIGHYLDKNHGERDDFWLMVSGTFLVAFIPLGYLFSQQSWHIYVLQMFNAIGMSMVIPSWSAIFTRHIDKGREALEWSVESTFLGIGAGIAGGMGGVIASVFGFNAVFLCVSFFNIISVVFLFLIKNDISPKNKEIIRVKPIKPL